MDNIPWVNQGKDDLQRRQYEKAAQNFSKAIELYPKAESYIYRAIAYYAMHDYDKAIADYVRAIELDPNYASVYYYKATALEGKHAYDAAIKAYEEFLKRADVSLAQQIEDAKRRIQSMQ